MAPSIRRYAGALAVFALASACLSLTEVGCVARPAFTCANNDACVRDGEQGICERDGSCSFADTSCPGSARRLAAGSSSETCVAVTKACVVAISAGEEHSCALKTDHTAFCWGSNEFGELGSGMPTANADGSPAFVATPTAVKMPAGVQFDAISLGAQHTCARATDGSVWCWGANGNGQLGVVEGGSKVAATNVPKRVPALSKITSIALGGKHSCAIDADAHAWCWGEGGAGQIGDGATVDRNEPVQVTLEQVTQLGVGDEHTCALAGGSVWCWGSNAAGQLGDAKLPQGATASATPVPLPSLLSVVTLVSGDEHACAVKGNHVLSCWGTDENGNVGDGQETKLAPITAVLDDVTDVWAGGQAFHTCAATNRDVGNLSCWGLNDFGQTATGVRDPSVVKPTPAKLISVSEVAVGKSHTCATTRDGALWCWGDNEFGQLGLGTSGLTSQSPTRVPLCN